MHPQHWVQEGQRCDLGEGSYHSGQEQQGYSGFSKESMGSKVVETDYSFLYSLFLHSYPQVTFTGLCAQDWNYWWIKFIQTQKLICATQHTQPTSYRPIFIYQRLKLPFCPRYPLKYYVFFPTILPIKMACGIFLSFCSYRWVSV